MLSVGSEAVKAKVIALYAVVLSNANHRRQNVRRGEANRVCGLTAPLLNPISLLPVSLPSSRFIPPLLYTSDPPLRNVLAQLPFPISRSAGKFFSTSSANTIKNTIYQSRINHPVESRFRVENCYSQQFYVFSRTYVGLRKFLPTSPLSLSFEREPGTESCCVFRGEEAVRQSRNATCERFDPDSFNFPSSNSIYPSCEDFRASQSGRPVSIKRRYTCARVPILRMLLVNHSKITV